jgi:hypothetical protein
MKHLYRILAIVCALSLLTGAAAYASGEAP